MSSVDAPPSPADAVSALTEVMRPVDPDAATVRMYRAWGKRTLDVVLSASLLVVLSPLFAVTGALVLWDLGRPVLFVQARTGRDGHVFEMRKFRTMRPDRRNTLAASPAARERRGVIPSSNDPRLTEIGRWLSRASLDELPQLVHVLLGDMSLVGPRPDYVFRLGEYRGDERRRFDVPGGVTGPWQVLVRTSTDLHEYVELDLLYVDRYSLTNDLRLLAATPHSALRRAHLRRRRP
jgi:lipopolysaccharide/colanic/teichoic acid biosynthesis glycosyltransferase